MVQPVAICLVSNDTALREDLDAVCESVNRLFASPESTRGLTRRDVHGMTRRLAQHESHDDVLHLLQAQLGTYIDQRRGKRELPQIELSVQRFATPDHARAALAAGLPATPEMCVVDLSDADAHSVSDNNPCAELLDLCRGAASPARLSPHSGVVVLPPACDVPRARSRFGNQHLRLPQASAAARRADLLRIVADHLEHAHLSRMLARWGAASDRPVSMAQQIGAFMRANWGEGWDFHSYTGSMVAGFIRSMHALNADSGVRCLTARNEHGLAAAALAGWQLHGRAFVIAVTSGMIDEFRGTLSNLRRARVPGLVVCADSPSTQWYPFQGTLDGENSGPAVVAAKGFDHVFVGGPPEVTPRLAEAFGHLARRPSPVFVFATQSALEAQGLPPPVDLPRVAGATADLAPLRHDALDEVMQLINHEPTHLLWQCGRLNETEHALVLTLAERAGIALADGLNHPGTVSAYHGGRAVPQYLGPLGMYGFSRKVYQFLHTDHQLNDRSQQCLFFLKSRIDQAATPFSEAKLQRQLRIVQVNRRAEHLAHFADIGLAMPVQPFLEAVLARLNVDPQVLQLRQHKLAAMAQVPEFFATDCIATEPMHINYFFRKLGGLVQGLIEERQYQYTGVYDVGRGGISAFRNVPRTGPGFSGWYGRALMGDALMATPYIVTTSPGHVLAFIGDGARGLVPDVEEDIFTALAARPDAAQCNVTVFYLCNGVLSLIQTYLDKRYAHNGVEQVSVPLRPRAAGRVHEGGLSVQRLRLSRFDDAALGEALSARGRLNFIEIVLSHNSEGDGLSLASETTWNRE